MGDTGSFTLGYILAFLAVRYVRNEPEVMPPAGGGTLVIAFATLIVPAFDVVRVALLRLRRGQGLFLPDRNHVHHKFLAMGFTPRRALVLILTLSSLFGVTNILLVPYINSTWLVTADVAVWMGLNLLWDRKITRNNLTV
jgi:UDP-N-acetylmuramyl pentapeptide phosphotransferase/UDP-N-acetylglucosamine-1-phosphate transferase